jgi:sugar diacid utilization regulator
VSDLEALDAITEAVESGAGLPHIVRAAARALDASLAVTDAWGATLAVAARSPAEERSLLAKAQGVSSLPLRVADTVVGTLHMRAKAEPSDSMRRLLVTMIASEVERVRAPERVSETAAGDFLRALLRRELASGEEILAGARELSLPVEDGASMLVARAYPQAPTDEGWRGRVRAVAERGARGVVNRSIAALSERDGMIGAEVLVLVPGGDEATAARAAEAVFGEMQAALAGYTFALGRSRVAGDAGELPRAASEALLAANVAQGSSDSSSLAFEQTGAYRLLLSAMSENPSELQRFYAETVEPLVAYDEQYETDLLLTLETFLEADGNVAGTAQRLFTHRHTIYYRLERVRELSGLDVSSSDGREKLSLGLKSMRVLGIASAAGPATEAGAAGGRVPRRGRRS